MTPGEQAIWAAAFVDALRARREGARGFEALNDTLASLGRSSAYYNLLSGKPGAKEAIEMQRQADKARIEGRIAQRDTQEATIRAQACADATQVVLALRAIAIEQLDPQAEAMTREMLGLPRFDRDEDKPHAFEQKRTNRFPGPVSETCERCGRDPRNSIHVDDPPRCAACKRSPDPRGGSACFDCREIAAVERQRR